MYHVGLEIYGAFGLSQGIKRKWWWRQNVDHEIWAEQRLLGRVWLLSPQESAAQWGQFLFPTEVRNMYSSCNILYFYIIPLTKVKLHRIWARCRFAIKIIMYQLPDPQWGLSPRDTQCSSLKLTPFHRLSFPDIRECHDSLVMCATSQLPHGVTGKHEGTFTPVHNCVQALQEGTWRESPEIIL